MKTSQPNFFEAEVRVIGPRWSRRVHELKDFLSRSRVPYRWLDPEEDSGARALAESAVHGTTEYPVVLFPDGSALANPDVRTVAERLGLETEPASHHYDLVIVGGGPAGLSASIYAASEGLRTVVVERGVPGGQASYSASIENYPGFPVGLSGSDLAMRTVQQAERFGVEILVTRHAQQLRTDGELRVIEIDDGTELVAHSVLLAMGVSFRWLDAPGCPSLVGAGIYYGSATAEAAACRAQDIYILGGGNSAAQAALLLAKYARRVTIVAHEDSIEETMSKYLVDRIRATPNIVVQPNSTVVGADGENHLQWITIENVKTGEKERVPADGLFVFIGATPQTDWLGNTVARDEQGFVLSGYDFLHEGLPYDWPLDRVPYPLETSKPGVFVAGDVRKEAVRRLTAAVGEGAKAVQYIHRYCANKAARAPAASTASASR
jgi:thioredoxin reductase (NADPH)